MMISLAHLNKMTLSLSFFLQITLPGIGQQVLMALVQTADYNSNLLLYQFSGILLFISNLFCLLLAFISPQDLT